MKKKALVVDVEKSQGKPWSKMSKAEFLKAATDAIVAGRHPSPPESYVSNGKLIGATKDKSK